MSTETMPRRIAADPSCVGYWADRYQQRFSQHSDFPDISREELGALFRRWAEESE